MTPSETYTNRTYAVQEKLLPIYWASSRMYYPHDLLIICTH